MQRASRFMERLMVWMLKERKAGPTTADVCRKRGIGSTPAGAPGARTALGPETEVVSTVDINTFAHLRRLLLTSSMSTTRGWTEPRIRD